MIITYSLELKLPLAGVYCEQRQCKKIEGRKSLWLSIIAAGFTGGWRITPFSWGNTVAVETSASKAITEHSVSVLSQ